MDIKNIALVRATNVIPFDGIVHPISETEYLKKETGTAFAYAINDLLRESNIINEDGYWTKTEEEQEQIDKQNKEILGQYLPYNSDYNSMVLWALNGLVPDDMNNTFSNKTCAIIESLEKQMDNSEIVSLVPTDTAIKGDVNLSDKSTILINKDRYESLTKEEKDKLNNLNSTIKIFDGKLQEAVDESLVNSEEYTSEQLSLTRANKGYLKSDTSEELIETINDIAKNHNIAQVLHWNVLTNKNDELEKLTSVKDEFKNINTVTTCYQKTFFQYLFSKMDIDPKVKQNILRNMDSSIYAKDLCENIRKIGIDKYKKIVEQYNSSLENLKEQGKLPTPQQIVDLTEANKDFDLFPAIQDFEQNLDEHEKPSNITKYLSELQEKYGYSDELIETLRKIVPAFIEHFGPENEQLILDAISSCKIHFQDIGEDTEKYISEFFPNMKPEEIPIIADAFYDSIPIVNGNEISSKRLIYITSKLDIDLQDESAISVLVHEMGHLVKSFNKEYSFVDGKIQQRSGISTKILNQDEENGKYIQGEGSNIGLEEAINCYDEEKIMSIILGREYTVGSYFHRLNDATNPLFENPELVDIFRNAQLYGTDAHIKHLGQEEFKTLSDYFKDLHFIIMKPLVAKRALGGGKTVPRLLQEVQSKILDYANKYKEKKEKNFSLDNIEELDKTVSFEERENGMKNLKENIQKTQEKSEIMEDKQNDSRV